LVIPIPYYIIPDGKNGRETRQEADFGVSIRRATAREKIAFEEKSFILSLIDRNVPPIDAADLGNR
jgi:hypothetical protein